MIDKPKKKPISKQIKDFIKDKSITIVDFCLLCSISRPTYYKLINWKHKYMKDTTINWLKKIWIEYN